MGGIFKKYSKVVKKEKELKNTSSSNSNKSVKMVYVPSSTAEFNDITKSGIVIVDFSASWCGPCKMIGPYFEELSKKYEANKGVRFLKVDVDELEEVSSNAGVSAMPSFFVYKDGQIVDQLIGASKDKLEALVKKYSE